jgi:hypothetical protein
VRTVAKRKTKAQKLASLRAKERAAKRTKEITKLDAWAISLYEIAESMRRAGFDDATIQGWLVDQRLPEWVAPRPDEFDDDEEEEDD